MAGTVAEALDSVSLERPRVVMLDLSLGGERGDQVARELVARYGQDAPEVVVCTGADADPPPEAAAVLRKPFGVDELFEILASLTGSA